MKQLMLTSNGAWLRHVGWYVAHPVTSDGLNEVDVSDNVTETDIPAELGASNGVTQSVIPDGVAELEDTRWCDSVSHTRWCG